MTPRKHLGFLLQGVGAWVVFWLVGLPDYYQQYSTVLMALASILLSVAISLAAIALLRRGPQARRMSRAFWLSFYYTVPFVLLDTAYCAWYLGHGPQYLVTFWYLTIFYVTPWLTFMPTAWLLSERAS